MKSWLIGAPPPHKPYPPLAPKKQHSNGYSKEKPRYLKRHIFPAPTFCTLMLMPTRKKLNRLRDNPKPTKMA